MLQFLLGLASRQPEPAHEPDWVDALMERLSRPSAAVTGGDANDLLAIIDAALARKGLSAAEALRQATGSASLIKNIRNGNSPTLRSLTALGRVLGLELVLRPIGGEAAVPRASTDASEGAAHLIRLVEAHSPHVGRSEATARIVEVTPEAKTLALAIATLPVWKGGRRPPWFHNLEVREFLVASQRQMTLSEVERIGRARFADRLPAKSAIHSFWRLIDEAKGMPPSKPRRKALRTGPARPTSTPRKEPSR